jgi:tetratricopeptide (TPR) repeat protein
VLDWRLGEAISILNSALADEGEDWVALSIRGWMNVGAGRLSEALADFERAMRVSPLEPDALAPYAWALFCSSGASEALSFAETTLQKRPDRPGLLLILATAALVVGDTARAQAAASHAIALTHRQPFALAAAAWIYASLNKRRKAIELIAEAEASPDQKSPLSIIAPAYLALGDHRRALRLFEQAATEREPGIFFASVDPRLVALKQQIQDVVRPLHGSAFSAML